jgi:hypothetical protein
VAIGPVRPGGRDVNILAVGGTSGLAESRSFSMQASCTGCPSLILCRLAGRDQMQLGAAMLHADWLGGRTLGDWHLG